MTPIEDPSIANWKNINNQASRSSFNQVRNSKEVWTDKMMSSTVSSSTKPILITVAVIGGTFVIFGVALGIYYATTNGKLSL
jgi:hypothetical protein